ncbi:MAG: adenylosuccinate synthetase, partial [Planctomycetota bacterium]|nr:adenylosuccinate synthetase [Planctomycetota bacterium]
FTQLTLTKLDVLGGLDELEVVIGYDLEGQHLSEMPACVEDQARVTCITEKVAGFPHMETSEWLELARKANGEGLGYSALPDGAREYVEKVEAWLGIPITSVGVGPDREATVYKV